MFRLQVLLEDHIDELAEIAAYENGKHATGRDGVEFYTEKKVLVERW